jgi:hypothetical protein
MPALSGFTNYQSINYRFSFCSKRTNICLVGQINAGGVSMARIGQNHRFFRIDLGSFGRAPFVEDSRIETTYLRQLFWADTHYGRNSGHSGMILLNLQDLYERQGRETAAAMMAARVVQVFRHHSEQKPFFFKRGPQDL